MMSTIAAGSDHPTSCLFAAELVSAIFFRAMKFTVALSAAPGKRPLNSSLFPAYDFHIDMS